MERYSDNERRSMRPQETRPDGVAATQARLLRCSSAAYLFDTRSMSRLASGNLLRRNCGHDSFLNGLLNGAGR